MGPCVPAKQVVSNVELRVIQIKGWELGFTRAASPEFVSSARSCLFGLSRVLKSSCVYGV